MIKNMAIKKIIITTLSFFIILLIYKLPSKENEINNNNIIKEKNIYFYVKDSENILGKINTNININDDYIYYIINTLTINSLNSVLLPSGFFGTIPENTKLISYNIEDKTLILNFSKELLNSPNINQTIESLIFSFCNNFINNIEINIENKSINTYINTLPLLFNKSFGINKEYEITNYKNNNKITVYYIKKYNNQTYYVPITKITNDNTEKLEVIIKELKRTPIYENNLITYLTASYEMKDYEIKEDSISITFNSPLLLSLDNEKIKEEIIYTLSSSIKDTYNISNILINFK